MIHTVNFTSLSDIFRVENLIFPVPLKNSGKHTQSYTETGAQRKGLTRPLLCNEFVGKSCLLHEIQQMIPPYVLQMCAITHQKPALGLPLPLFPNALPGTAKEAAKKFGASEVTNQPLESQVCSQFATHCFP